MGFNNIWNSGFGVFTGTAPNVVNNGSIAISRVTTRHVQLCSLRVQRRLLQVASRLVFLVAGALLMVMSCFGKINVVFATAPQPVVAAVFIVCAGLKTLTPSSKYSVPIQDMCYKSSFEINVP